FIRKHKKIITLVGMGLLTVATIAIVVWGVKKGNKSEPTVSSPSKEVTNNNNEATNRISSISTQTQNNGHPKNVVVNNIAVEESTEAEMKNTIKKFINDKFIETYRSKIVQNNDKIGGNGNIFNFAFFELKTYNSIDKTITGQTNNNQGGKNYLIQPGSFNSPIKDAPDNLLAVYFDGGSKRGGDEEEGEEGDSIPKYTLDELKQMSNDASSINIFWKKTQPIETIEVDSYEQMAQKIKEINPNINMPTTKPNNYKASYNACQNDSLDWEIKNPSENLLGVYIGGDNQTLTSETDITLDELKLKTKYEHKIYIFNKRN
ncbi:hypothetical protein HR065_03585, partial [Candidatus Phytoplasma pruni]|nr:hypothetical protein [Candidatus Phytoplasma pruni]